MREMLAPPRIVTVGAYQSALGAADDGLRAALAGRTRVASVDAAPGPRGWLMVAREIGRALRDGAECIHVLDARLAGPALSAGRRHGVPVTATVVARRGSRSVLRGIDQCFVHDPGDAAWLAERGVRAIAAPPGASSLPEPSPQRLAEMVRLTGDATLGRLIVAAPWPADREAVVWLRDAVAPLLHGNPLVLLLGAPRGRDARLLMGAIGHRRTFRLHRGRIDADVIAAAARCADAFVVPGEAGGGASMTDLLLALTASRAPVVIGGGVRNGVLEHERNALLVEAGDPLGLASSLNQLLALPAIQRHYLGEEFAAHTLDRWPWAAAAAEYLERFAALVGRPQIPADLRAA